jgi:O-antigen/teichoic acid export membrane protein
MTATRGEVGRRRLTGDIAVQLAGRAINLALGVVVTVALVRYLGDRRYGEWSTLLAICALITAAGAQTLPRVVIPKAAEDPENERAWLGAFVAVQSFIAVPGTLLAIVISLIVAENHEMRMTGFVLSILVFLNLPSALGAVFQLRVRNDVVTALGIANSVVWTGGVLVIRAVGGGLVPIAVMFVSAGALTGLVTLLMSARMLKFDWAAGRALRKTTVRIAVPVAMFGLAVTAYNAIDTLMVFELSGARDAGLYGATYRILDQAGVFPAAIVTTLTPIVASSYRTNLARTHRLLQAAADALAVLSFFAIAIAISAGAPILELLYGHEFSHAAPALAILMVAFALIGMGYVYGSLVVVLGMQRKVLPYALLALAVNIVLNLIFIPPFGYTAAAVVTVITEAIVLSLTVRVIGPMLQFKVRRGGMIRTALAAAGMCLFVWLLRLAGVPVGGLVGAALVSYPVLLLVLRAVDRRELVSLVTEK